jgi:hypothetical protein
VKGELNQISSTCPLAEQTEKRPYHLMNKYLKYLASKSDVQHKNNLNYDTSILIIMTNLIRAFGKSR